MGTPNENLLDAEKAVQDLLGTLKDLRKEVGEHADSGKLLTTASSRLDRLFEAQAKIGSALESACEATRKVGTAELLSQLERVSAAVVTLEKEAPKRAQAEELLRDLIQKLRTEAQEREKKVESLQEALSNSMTGAFDRIEVAVKKAQVLAMWAAGAGLLATILAAVGYLKR